MTLQVLRKQLQNNPQFAEVWRELFNAAVTFCGKDLPVVFKHEKGGVPTEEERLARQEALKSYEQAWGAFVTFCEKEKIEVPKFTAHDLCALCE